MTFYGLTFAAVLMASALLDAMVRPRAGAVLRAPSGLWLLACMTAALFGLVLAACGNAIVALVLVLGLQALLLVASNAKHIMLGEPLLFSDLALVGAIFRHPQFYLSAVAVWQRVAAGGVAAILLAIIVWFSRADAAAHAAGLALLLASAGALALSLRLAPPARRVPRPDAHADVRRLGLLPVLLLYWLRWRESVPPPPCPEPQRVPPDGAPEIIVIVQCESFADPADLFADATLALPGLAFARANAWRSGHLDISGFGAYTMRTEYGVLFGREEDSLGFRRYDPFLTALTETSYTLPARLQGWQSFFIHPHDMRFYGRDRIMPAGGFAELVGEDRFARPSPGEGRYVTDAAIAREILSLATAADGPSLYYAVTIENHGPWKPVGGESLLESYLRFVRNSDAMLTTLLGGLQALKRPALLVFFGDHRPSIPGASAPPPPDRPEDRQTPYVMVRIGADGEIRRDESISRNMTPAALHHAVLEAALGKV